MVRLNGMGPSVLLAASALAGATACSSSSMPAPAADAAAPDATSVSEGDGSADGGAGVTLTVLNFLNWCSVTINGGAASTAASMTATVASGSTATIVATPASSMFQIGPDPWLGVSEDAGGPAAGADDGSGATETTTATVVVTGDHCVSVCCQLPNNGPPACPTPTTNPCP